MTEQCDDDASDVSEVDESEENQYETTKEEPDYLSDGVYEPETETDSASENEEDDDSSGNRYIYLTFVILL